MRAIRVTQFGGPEVLKLEETANLKPDSNQIVVTIKAAGVNPVEAYIRSGTYPVKPTLPYTPGADGSGIVEVVGESIKNFKPGDRVYVIQSISGTYAQQAVASDIHVYPLPEKITFAQGAAMGVPYGTAYQALFHRAKAQKDETILIHGASGGVGTAAVQLAKRAGLTVIGTGGTEKGRSLVKTEGADHVLDHHDPNFSEKLVEVTGGKGVNIILEMLANINLAKDLTYLSKFGRIVVIGSRGAIEINPRDGMGRDADIRFMTLFNATPQELQNMHGDMVQGLKDGSLNPVIGREIPLESAALAHEAIMKPGAYGKIVLIP